MNKFAITNVLLLDDEAFLREALAAYLEDEGFTVSEAGDCRSALLMLATRQVELAVVDITLPDANGDFFIREASRRWPGMKFIIHTGCSEYTLPRDLALIGMNSGHILRKPLADLDLLKSAILSHGRYPDGGSLRTGV